MINTKKIINMVLFFAHYTKYFGKTKLYKLLFWADFAHFKQTGRSITGYNYTTWDFGPVPDDLKNILEKKQYNKLQYKITVDDTDEFHKVLPLGEANEKVFTPRELKILEELADTYKEAKAEEIVKDAHLEGSPWEITKTQKGMHEHIDFILALDSSPDSVSEDFATEKLQEEKDLDRMVGCHGK